ncbi:MAG: response regulator transcription factor [Clostridiales Family XIII bacterium]|nr:response regulator transcription factor [Clostridiales Family XIII bacterium]
MQRILIIEDDPVICRELRAILERYGYEPIVAEDFNDIIGFALSENPQLILLDLNLPFFDGYHVCREIRKRSRVPIIVVTSRDSEMDELMSMNLGADYFVTKPYSAPILMAKISAALNRAGDAEAVVLRRFGELTLDSGRGVVSRGDKRTELTKNELGIMELLIAGEGNIVSRDEIMNALWQTDEFIDDNTLTVNVNRLRKKLDSIGAKDAIKTRRGQGYSL